MPPKIEGNKLRGDQKLRKILIEVLATMNFGWIPDIVGTTGEVCVLLPFGLLILVNINFESMVLVFHLFEGYNNWKAKEEKKPRLLMKVLICNKLVYHKYLTEVGFSDYPSKSFMV